MLALPITFADLEVVDRELYRNLRWMRENEGVDALCLDFSVTEDVFGAAVTVELVEGGRDVELTDENKDEYIALRVKHRLLGAIRQQLRAFLTGFYEVIPMGHLSVFDHQELELLLCGVPTVDVEDWKANTRYRGELDAAHRLVGWFWEVVGALSDEEKAKLIQFVTGTSRVPIQGFAVRRRAGSALDPPAHARARSRPQYLQGNDGRVERFTIQPIAVTESSLPRAHTCFNRCVCRWRARSGGSGLTRALSGRPGWTCQGTRARRSWTGT